MRYDRISRRFFLQGVGGATLAVPFLGSLVPKAEAAESGVAAGPLKNLIMIKQSHGASYENIMPPSTLAYESLGNGMRRAPLPADFQAFGASYMRADLKDLREHINHITGLDCTFERHDHWNNFLLTGNPASDLTLSVDQVVAKHIYGSSSPVISSMVLGFNEFTGEGPGYDDNGTIRKPQNFRSQNDTYQQLFAGFARQISHRSRAWGLESALGQRSPQ
jgi:hypothetical protein